MSGEQNIETVKTIYEAFGRGDLDAILELCTDDVDWATDSALEVAPWHGVKHGKAEVPSFFAGIAQTGPVIEFTPLSFAGNDDGDVMVFLRYAFTVTATCKDVATNLRPLLSVPSREGRLLPRVRRHRADRLRSQHLSPHAPTTYSSTSDHPICGLNASAVNARARGPHRTRWGSRRVRMPGADRAAAPERGNERAIR